MGAFGSLGAGRAEVGGGPAGARGCTVIIGGATTGAGSGDEAAVEARLAAEGLVEAGAGAARAAAVGAAGVGPAGALTGADAPAVAPVVTPVAPETAPAGADPVGAAAPGLPASARESIGGVTRAASAARLGARGAALVAGALFRVANQTPPPARTRTAAATPTYSAVREPLETRA